MCVYIYLGGWVYFVGGRKDSVDYLSNETIVIFMPLSPNRFYLVFQQADKLPLKCPPNSYCPTGSFTPHSCDPPLWTVDHRKHTCKPTEELIAIIAGVSVGMVDLYLQDKQLNGIALIIIYFTKRFLF